MGQVPGGAGRHLPPQIPGPGGREPVSVPVLAAGQRPVCPQKARQHLSYHRQAERVGGGAAAAGAGSTGWSASTTTPWTSISIRSGSSWWISSSGPSPGPPPLSGHEPLPKLRERTDAMKKLSRAKNTMRNTLWGAIYRVATLIRAVCHQDHHHQGAGTGV